MQKSFENTSGDIRVVSRIKKIVFETIKGRLFLVFSPFVGVYLALFLFFAIGFYFFLSLDIARLLVFSTGQNPLMWAIYLLIAIGIIISLVTFWNTLKEQAVINSLIKYRNEINLEKGKLPLKKMAEESILVGHFQKFYTATKQKLSERTKVNLEEYLKEVFFSGTNRVGFIQEILPLLGLLGTAYGLAGACLNKAEDASMFASIAIAIGSTVVAICGKLMISTLNYLVISERWLQLRSLLVILGLEKEE